ncbi:MAG: hypothetical protein JNM17_21365 [Archangium sp.]|nr:hypothetical protein [Archangium sp.]
MLVALVAVLLSQDPDAVSGGLARAKTVEKCVSIYTPAKKTFPTAYIRGVSVEAADCTRRVMNAELDTVLVPLKKSDAPRFKLGMQAQASFNTAVKKYCGRWERWYADCCSTCSFTEQPECEMDFHAARLTLLKAVGDEGAAKRERTTKDFSEFATQWCQFLGDTSDTCASRVLGVLEHGQRDDGRELKCGK